MNSQQKSILKERFMTFLKLFVVMGVLWIFSIASELREDQTIYTHWFLIDVVNMLQGFVIFLIFVTKPDARREIKKRIYGRGNNRNLLELTKPKATATKCRSPPSS